MNWTKVKDKSPKSWDVFKKHFDIDIDHKNSMMNYWVIEKWDEKTLEVLRYDDYECGHNFNVRELYDFFDEQGFYIKVEKLFNLDTDWLWMVHWFETGKGWMQINEPKHLGFKTRTEAEYKAFEEAFDLLEKK